MFGKDVHSYRRQLGLSQEDLARKAGIDVKTLRSIESGRRKPRPSTVRQLAAALDLNGADRDRFCASASPDAAGRPAAGPAQLPLDVFGFTGRAADLVQLDTIFAAADQQSTAVVISAIAGTAGVGKTALAVHWAHQVRDQFPDGQLHVDLRGYDADQPMNPADALAGFLRALGANGSDIPQELAERAAQYRTLLSGRRILVVLDNASTVEQVRPLLPGSGSCVVVVTSRDRLTGLVTRHGARRVDLDLLSPTDATALLRRLLGERVGAEPQHAAVLAERCARLPLALRVAAELAAARPATSLAELVTELADERARLDLLDAEADDQSGIRAVFSWSYRRLDAGAARMFRLLALHPGDDCADYAAAALADTDLAAGRQLLAVLVRAHLVQDVGSGRYRMHDLLRAYAAERADEEEAETDRRAAAARLIHHYLATAAAAMEQLNLAARHSRPRVPAPTHSSPPMTTQQHARDWLDAERVNLVATTVHAADHGWPVQAVQLSETIWSYLSSGVYVDESLVVGRRALRAAGERGDRRAEATAQVCLGGVCMQLARYDEAAERFRLALTGFRAVGDLAGTARALSDIGWTHAQRGRYPEALGHYRQALADYRAAGHRVGEAIMLGWIGLELGRARRFEEAIDHLRRALANVRALGTPDRVIEVLSDLGQVLLWAGRHEEVAEPTREALALCRRQGLRLYEGDLLNNLAESHAELRLIDEALTCYRSALTVTRECGNRDIQARALDGIGTILHTTGHPREAQEHWQEALAIYTELGMPQAEEVRTRLAALSPPSPRTASTIQRPAPPAVGSSSQ